MKIAATDVFVHRLEDLRVVLDSPRERLDNLHEMFPIERALVISRSSDQQAIHPSELSRHLKIFSEYALWREGIAS